MIQILFILLGLFILAKGNLKVSGTKEITRPQSIYWGLIVIVYGVASSFLSEKLIYFVIFYSSLVLISVFFLVTGKTIASGGTAIKSANTKRNLIILLVFLTMVAGVFAWQFWPEQEPKASGTTTPGTTTSGTNAPARTAEDETADWKNYKNEKLGFEFKYPKEYLFTDPAFGEGFRMYSNESGRIYSKDNILPTIDFAFYTTPDAMSVAVDKFPRTFKDLATDKNLKNIKEKTFRGDEAFEATFVNENINLELNQLYIYHNGHVYVWSIDTRHGDAGKKMFENILSTFRFLPPRP